MAAWSSLPADLITHVTDGLLATDDIDYYIDLRAVCHSWRSSTADPKTSGNPRFQLRQWAMLDEVYQSDARLFVNTSTGRFVRKDLSLLRRSYFVVAGAGGSSIVLAERASPHAARVLNPFTGSLQALVGGIYAAAREPGLFPSRLVTEAQKILDLLPCTEELVNCLCFLVESVGEMLLVFKLQHRFGVFKIDPASDLLVPVKDIGSRALFVGGCRCLSVDAELFPSVEANCIYYVIDEPLYDICIYSLKDEKLVVAGGAIDYFNPHTLSPLACPPFTVVQLLCSYTFELRGSELRWEKMFTQLSGMDKELFARLTEELSAYDCESDDDY
ncbi:hypothetical protein HU200_000800 [Digitaria exilis]|uniref:KIB1-4 beta-propeller domain-containing protein n=1 Tax=Digitaria exilis TaxID=1010633 RepID=A0A835KV44_9POAL|nr:hypothetical protein HU200_000800 [Digitaria exilis]CAB3457566.1 unnamed protein product [Digitaria exilis]